jgi:excisionase family DNA binding protein
MYTAVTITQMTPIELENLIEKVFKKSLEKSTVETIPMILKAHFTKREAAAELSCSVPMIDKLIQQGRLDKVKVGTKVLIPREGIERILSNKKGANYAK